MMDMKMNDNEKNDKREAAFRLMLAMSEVDAELLERSEKQQKSTGSVVLFMARYRAAVAACIGLVVLGSAFWGMNHIRMGSTQEAACENSTTIMTDEIAKNDVNAVAEECAEVCSEMEESSQQPAYNGSQEDTATEDVGGTGSTLLQSGNSEEAEKKAAEKAQEEKEEYKEVCYKKGWNSYFDAYLPEELPGGYNLKEYTTNEGPERTSVLLTWESEEDAFSMEYFLVADAEDAQKTVEELDGEANLAILTADERGLVTGETDLEIKELCLFHEDGVLILYRGNLEYEDIEKVLKVKLPYREYMKMPE